MTLPSFRTLRRASPECARASAVSARASAGRATCWIGCRLRRRCLRQCAVPNATRPKRWCGHYPAASRASGPRRCSELAGQTSRWLPDDPRRAFAEVPQYADRVPTILYQIRQGGDPEVIGRRLSPLGGGWPVRRSVEIAAGLIAGELNRSRQPVRADESARPATVRNSLLDLLAVAMLACWTAGLLGTGLLSGTS